ncbi:MAG: hypothetical protein WCD81_10125 [Candidatus Bathyarchaeia archaeon]
MKSSGFYVNNVKHFGWKIAQEQDFRIWALRFEGKRDVVSEIITEYYFSARAVYNRQLKITSSTFYWGTTSYESRIQNLQYS